MSNYLISVLLWSISFAITIYSVLWRKWDWLTYAFVITGMLFVGMMINYNLTLVPGWERP